MSPGARNRLVSGTLAGAAVLLLQLLFDDPARRAFATYATVVALGYGHLVGALQPRALVERCTPGGVSRLLGAAFLVVSLATALALYMALLAVDPRVAAPLLAASVWHAVENDGALQEAYRGRGRPGPLRSGSGELLAFGGGLLALSAWLASGGVGALAEVAFAVPALYHVVSWAIFQWDRATWLEAAGRASDARRLQRRLVLSHGAPLALGVALLVAAGPAVEGLRGVVFSPALYLFWSSAHVLDTALKRRPLHAPAGR